MNSYLRLFGVLVLFYGIGVVYEQYKITINDTEDLVNYDIVREFLLNDSSLANSKKPILWIPTIYDFNSRNWENFLSRGNNNLNQPYLYITIKSIIDNCGKDFNICLIDDNSFQKLIPNWTIDLNKIASPIKDHIRNIAMLKVLYYYGGMTIPNSTLCIKNLMSLYKQGIEDSGAFIIENNSNSIVSDKMAYFPDINFMGCQKNDETIKHLIKYLEYNHSRDFTSEQDFLAIASKWCYQESLKNNITIIDGKYIGIKKCDDTPVLIEDLFSENHIDLCNDIYAIYIPREQILNRTKYNWFARSSTKQILESNMAISKYMLICN